MSGRLEAWQPATAWAGPDRTAIDVWQCPLRLPRPLFESRLAFLTSSERERAARFHRDLDREAYVATRGFLRERLAAYLGGTPAAVPLTEGSHGKPEIAMSGPRWEFNVSHSGNLGLVAVAWDRAVGVDIEQRRELTDLHSLAERFFSPVECDALNRAPKTATSDWFYAIWTRKESFIKATGLGLSFPLDQFSVSAAPDDDVRLLELAGEPSPGQRWQMWDVAVGEDYAGALAAAGTRPDSVRGWL